MKDVVAAYKDNKDVKSIQGTGFHIGGVKYITLRADDRSLYGKKVRPNCAQCPMIGDFLRFFTLSKKRTRLPMQLMLCTYQRLTQRH